MNAREKTLMDEAIEELELSADGFVSADNLSKRKRIGWRIKDVVPRKGLCAVWGAPGSGKSFLVIDMVCSIVRGLRKYHGKRIRPGIVIYYAMEGNLQDRIDAYKLAHGIKDGELSGLYVKHRTVNFTNHVDVMNEVDAMKRLANGREVAAVVIDTLARSMPGGDENGRDMGSVIGGYNIVEEELNTCVMAIHHSGKDSARGMRGHSSLLGAIDSEIEIQRNGDDRVRVVRVGKQKEGEDQYNLFNFELERVELGFTSRWDEDADPDEIDSSCVVRETFGEPTRQAPKAPPNVSDLVSREIVEMLEKKKGSMKRQEILELMKSSASRSSIYAAISKLIESGEISEPMKGVIQHRSISSV